MPKEINISADNVIGECELKCAYTHKYLNSSCMIKLAPILLYITITNMM